MIQLPFLVVSGASCIAETVFTWRASLSLTSMDDGREIDARYVVHAVSQQFFVC